MKTRISNMVWGILLIAAGVGYAGNSLGFWDFSIFFRGWWTLFIIIPCLVNLIQYGPNGGNIAGLCIGAALLLNALGIVEFAVIRRLLIPVLLILLGLSLLFGNSGRRIRDEHGNKLPYGKGDAAGADISAVFNGKKVNFNNQEFSGASVDAVFGGVDLDLRMAVVEQDVRIDATAVFGGINILVPSNVVVKVVSTPVLGGVTNKAAVPTEVPCHTLYINATCVFGGVEVK